MSITKLDIDENITWENITPGCNIFKCGTSELVNTGDWRTMKPILHADICRHCLLCIPVCPDMSISVDENGKRGDFNYFFCKGCGICSEVCPFGAIEMVREEK